MLYKIHSRLVKLDKYTPKMNVFKNANEAILLTPDYGQKLTEYKTK